MKTIGIYFYSLRLIIFYNKPITAKSLVTHMEKRLPVYSKKWWVVLTQLWVKYGLTQPLG